MLRDIDLAKVNSLTKYPSIETYHTLGEKGRLTEKLNFDFSESNEVILTEKVDGTNGRIVFLPSGEWLIGSREEFFTAEGDVVYNTGLGIVDGLRATAERLKSLWNPVPDILTVFYFEVYGAGIGGQAKNYTTKKGVTSARLFDIVEVYDLAEKLTWDREYIANWRDNGGQWFAPEPHITSIATVFGLQRVPVLNVVPGDKLPTTVEDMRNFLGYTLSATLVALDETARKAPEGVVLRTPSRHLIAKARFQDYDRTLKARQ